MELEEKIESDVFNKPYFVFTNDQERFFVVKSISGPNEDNNIIYSSYKKDDGLILGKDIKEEHTRGLNILVEYPTNNKHLLHLLTIRESQKFAKLCLCDYVGLEIINGFYSCEILTPGYARVQPRLFRRIIDN